MEDCYKGFVEGVWSREINVRDFIQKNYTPYDGDDSFLGGADGSHAGTVGSGHGAEPRRSAKPAASWIWIPRSSPPSPPTARAI